jgi:hypothetical protein
MNFKAIAAATLFCMSTSAASAAPVTYNFVGTLGQVDLGLQFDFTVSFDNTESVNDGPVTVNSFIPSSNYNSWSPTIVYDYNSSSNFIFIGAGSDATSIDSTPDFYLFYEFGDDLSGTALVSTDQGSGSTFPTLTVTEIAPVPLPAAGWMLLAGIGGLGVMARRRKA